MSTSAELYRQMIVNGIQNLPPNLLSQIADYVYFVRKRAEQPETFAQTLYQDLLSSELTASSHFEWQHLEQEFADYEQRYPLQ